MTKTALDTNILVYLYDDTNLQKRNISESLILETPLISTQVISEYINVTKRLLRLPKIEVFDKCCQVFDKCRISPVSHQTLHLAKTLIQKYDFQLFDSIIVASALEANCAVLYSEDFQHNQLVEDKLRIINPFL